MDRRGFLLQSSLAWASLAFPKRLAAQSPGTKMDALLQGEQPLRRIAFGSCNHASRGQGYWQYVLQDRPDLWLWLGDNIYADHATAAERRQIFDQLKNDPFYSALRKTTAVVGTWDDHDYGYNNADGSFADKDASKDILLNFLDVAADNPVWNREGVYQSYSFGPEGQKIQIILLDLRWGMIQTGVNRRLLAEDQWTWLEKEIRDSTADLIFIGSSLNVTSPVTVFGLEGWRHYANDQQRLYALLDEIQTPMVLLSGDRHFAEVYRVELPSGRPIYEFMSSGLTHAIGVKLPHAGRLGDMVGYKNYGLLEIDWTPKGPEVGLAIKSAEQYRLFQEFRTAFQV